MTNEEFEPIRIRIMKEAYDLADKNDTEGYNSVKVMCNDVQNLLRRKWVGLTDDEINKEAKEKFVDYNFMSGFLSGASFAEAKLKEKNT